MKPSGSIRARCALLSLVLAWACGGGGGSDSQAPTTPVANAGPDQNVMVGWLVTLDGTASSNASTYQWTFTSWPGSGAPALSSAAAGKPTFTPGVAGAYTLSLVVHGGQASSTADGVTVTAVDPRPVPDTGQALCYDPAGSAIPCLNSGQDGAYNVTNQPSHTDNLDGTVGDDVTGLVWRRCPVGLSGTNCATGTVGAYNWYQATGTADATYNAGGAINVCGAAFAGHSDWRVPTDFELMGIVDYGAYGPAIDAASFPGTLASSYWSSTTQAGSPTWAWNVEFYDGLVDFSPKSTSAPSGLVRCVRGSRSAPVFTDNGDGTVTDDVTGLMWQKQGDSTQRSWVNAIAYCEGLSLGGHADWRMPNVRELRSIVDPARYGPAIDPAVFSSTATDYYWSSTTSTSLKNYAWIASFNNGYVANNVLGKTLSAYVRCVR